MCLLTLIELAFAIQQSFSEEFVPNVCIYGYSHVFKRKPQYLMGRQLGSCYEISFSCSHH
jgi:hypothetical protein